MSDIRCRKVGYMSSKDARKTMRTARAARAHRVERSWDVQQEQRVYRCEWCGLWHTTSSDTRTDRAASEAQLQARQRRAAQRSSYLPEVV